MMPPCGKRDFSYITSVKNRAMRFLMDVGKYKPNRSLYGAMQTQAMD